MPHSTPELGTRTPLRAEAESRLKQGTAPATAYSSVSADALKLLYQLASDPERARQGLKLLHELQVHQVELDLQREQLDANEREIFESLTRYRTFFDCAPVGYFIVTLDGQVIECNIAGATLLGIDQQDLDGHLLSSFLTPGSAPELAGLLKKLRGGATSGHCSAQISRLQRDGSGVTPHPLHIAAGITPRGETVLMVVSAPAAATGV